jgi:dephospho-CoA kinase
MAGSLTKQIPVIGLAGGVASGKTTVANMLSDLGARVLDADRTGHDVLQSAEVKEAIRSRWGGQAFGDDGRVDRTRLGKLVFGVSEEALAARRFLEQLTHPRIGEQLARQARQFEQEGDRAVVLDAPLLFEAGWDKLCDTVVFVESPRELRRVRAKARGWSEQEFAAREAAQHSLARKRCRADVVIDNSESLEATRSEVLRLWRSLFG